MGQQKRSTHSRKGKHLDQTERIQIEGLLKAKVSPAEIARVLGRHVRTIEREIKKGMVERLNTDLTKSSVYNADRAQDVHDLNATAKGPDLKLGAHHKAVEFIREQIIEEQSSPDVVAHRMNEQTHGCEVCTSTIYSYIDQGLIKGVSNESLLEKPARRKRRNNPITRKPKKHPTHRKSIEKRPEEVESREVFGHWEIDLIVGGKGTSTTALLTLVERKTRKMIIRKIADRTQESVLKALASIERTMGAGAFRAVFKTITADNGSEFLDVEAMEKSAFSKKKRTRLFYAHAYASWERGSNENGNRMIRRFIKKGRDIASFGRERVRQIEEWINRYPRKILDFRTAEERYVLELAT
ncbi:MAG: IS30 family transposase [bacterium]|nr:IS30 family transposase [bacterium]